MTEPTHESLPNIILSALADGPKSRRELERITGEPNLIKQISAMRVLGTVTTVGQRRSTKYALTNAENQD